jgi:hypothetical protein
MIPVLQDDAETHRRFNWKKFPTHKSAKIGFTCQNRVDVDIYIKDKPLTELNTKIYLTLQGKAIPLHAWTGP